MRALVPGFLFLLCYLLLVYLFSYVTIMFGEPGDAGLLGTVGFAILLSLYLSLAAFAGAFAVSLDGLHPRQRVLLSSVFAGMIAITLWLVVTVFERLAHDTFASLGMVVIAVANVVLTLFFVRIAYAVSRRNAVSTSLSAV